eukprot:3445629-Rhodomonas_salina.1
MSDVGEDDKLTPNLSAWKGAHHFQAWKVELQTECMRLKIEYIVKSAQHAFSRIQMEVDPALLPPGALGAGQRVLKTSIDDYDDASWKS